MSRRDSLLALWWASTQSLSRSIRLVGYSISRMNMMFMPLDESERLTTGSVVGIDAEFVTLNQVGGLYRPVHPPYSSVFVTEFNPEYGNTDWLIWLRKRSSPKCGNCHHLNIFFTVISCVKNVAPSVGNVHVPLYYARCQATRNIP